MNQSKNSYFVNDSQIADMSRKVVEMFYKNSKIASYIHTGKTLTGAMGILLKRPISTIYSNIDGHTSLSMILKNAIHFSILTNSNATLEAEFKPIREATERKKNQLAFFERKKKKNEETGVEDEKTLLDIETTQAEIKLLEEKLDQIASAAGPPIVNSSILNLAKRVYEILLRGDRTSQNLYVEICRNLGITINIAERFFEKTMDQQKHDRDVGYEREEYKPRYTPFKQEKGTYVPPALQHQHSRSGYRDQRNRPPRPFDRSTETRHTEAAAAVESAPIHKKDSTHFPNLPGNTEEKEEVKEIKKIKKGKSMFSLLDVDDEEEEHKVVATPKKSSPKARTLGVWGNVSNAVKAAPVEEESEEEEEEIEEEKPRMVVLGKVTRRA
jgi:hypothetical protein